jgi:hypothetical protein
MQKCRVPCSKCLLHITFIILIFVYSRCMLKIGMFIIKDGTGTRNPAHGTKILKSLQINSNSTIFLNRT